MIDEAAKNILMMIIPSLMHIRIIERGGKYTIITNSRLAYDFDSLFLVPLVLAKMPKSRSLSLHLVPDFRHASEATFACSN